VITIYHLAGDKKYCNLNRLLIAWPAVRIRPGEPFFQNIVSLAWIRAGCIFYDKHGFLQARLNSLSSACPPLADFVQKVNGVRLFG